MKNYECVSPSCSEAFDHVEDYVKHKHTVHAQ